MLIWLSQFLGYPSAANALRTIEVQRETIEIQRRHIRELNERISKLERENDGIMSLI